MDASIAGTLLAFSLLVSPCSHPSITSEYDHEIRVAVDHYWPIDERIHWCDYKAQLIQESALNPTAVSPVGAVGLAQIMPLTWADIAPKAGLVNQSPTSATASIRAGAWYMAWLGRRMTEPRDYTCRSEIKMAGYNAGLGNVWKAQRKARRNGLGARCFDEIRRYLPHVTGQHAKETCRYVDIIPQIRKKLTVDRRLPWGRIKTPGCLKGAS